MWLHKLVLLGLLGLAHAQDDGRPTLRLRRPRPQLQISNPDGIAEGRPIPLQRGIPVDALVSDRQNTADLLAAALTNDEADGRGESLQSTDALQSLLATANDEDDYPIIEEEPLLDIVPERPTRPGRTRRPPGVPTRGAPRARDNEEKGQRLPGGDQRQPERENVGTSERYSHTNEDGSFTFGYVSEDGSFREETRGVDCITRGKYGYIDPDGKKREFTYVSGLPCDVNGEENSDSLQDEDDVQREDPINPGDRFRTGPVVQLDQDEIPDSARPRQRIPERNNLPDLDIRGGDQFTAFQQQQRPEPRPQAPVRTRDPALANRRPAAPTGSALDNLLSIADGAQPTRQPVAAPRPRPTTPRPPQTAFESDLDAFTLNKPAITFDEENKSAQPTPGPNFSTELVFDPTSGTFKTELRQALPASEEASTAAPAEPATDAPTARPFTVFAPTTVDSSAQSFEPLTFPSPRPTSPSPAPSTPSPVTQSSQPASPTPSPAGSFFFQPFPTLGSPRPITATTPQPQRVPTPTPSFINLSSPQPQPTSGQAFPLQPQPTGQAFPQPTQFGTPLAQPFSIFNSPRPLSSAATSEPPVPAPTQPAASPTQAPQVSPAGPTPQVQFGFQPIPQQQQQQAAAQPPRPSFGQPQFQQAGRPFTAFAQGPPPQLSGAPRPAQFFGQPQFQARPQGFQLGVPPQLQQQQQPGGRFEPSNRPAPPPSGASPFTVFNPAALRGARFF